MPTLEIFSVSEKHNEVCIAIGDEKYFFHASGASLSLSGEAEVSAAAVLGIVNK
jgi:hypothetical protein